MRTISPTGRFRRDLKRELKGRYGKQLIEELDSLVDVLAADRQIDARFVDHALTGNWRGYRDCHVRPDLVLIYKKIGDDRLELERLGSHSELRL